MLRPVIVGVDESPESLAATEWATREALRRDVPLRLVHAWNWSPHPASDVPAGATAVGAAQRVRARSVLDTAEAAVRTYAPALPLTADPLEGPAAAALLHIAAQADLLVLGSRGLSSVTGVVVGSVANHVAGASPVPIVLVRSGGSPLPYRSVKDESSPEVVLGLDLTDPCDEVIEFAFAAAEQRGARLHVLSAWRNPSMYALGPGEIGLVPGLRRQEEWYRFQEAVLQSWRTKFPTVTVAGTVVEGRAGTPLLAAAKQASLVVVGRHAHATFHVNRGNGPVTHAVVHQAPCPVAIVPHP
ncbi:universal stress protein [Streptomyces sp. SID14478]|uniref:universal stress protein n=1 Tax=Streptomyces sp. SID14478 TaxID=2706073 RepID=UPI0013DA4108|nr:universal stress protein [Streptomyces sp. SID14478]NEB74244.1 universal stress protein [Streptomyces sp. SID14478]